MKKLGFLIGKWSGEATMLRPTGQYADMSQTEDAQYMLDGLVLMIQGVGRSKTDGKPVLEALGLVTFDDESGTCHMRAFNDGRWLECEVKLEDGHSISWGLTMGVIKTHTILRIKDKGEWTEHGELTIGDGAPRKLMELTVRRVSEK